MVSVVQLHVTVVQSKGHGTVFTSEYCAGGQTVVGTPHSVTPGPYILWSFLNVPGIWKTYGWNNATDWS